MANIPTREELYAEVDRLFRQDFPDAPDQLSRNRPEDEWYRDAWLAIRDKVLYSITDEVFFDGAPGAPYPLDPDNPDHDSYVREWIDIRDAIMNNAPLPPVGDIDDPAHVVDMHFVRQGIEESMARLLDTMPPDVHDEIRRVADSAPDQIYDAFLLGEVPTAGQWFSEPVLLVIPEGSWRLYVSASWDEALDQMLKGELVVYE